MREQVRNVGLVMIIVGGLNLALYALSLLVNLAGMGAAMVQGTTGMEGNELLGYLFGYGLMSVLPAINIVGGLLWIISGARLMGMHNRMFAVVLLIMGAIPCCITHPCCTWIFTLPVSAWGLTVLFSTEVEAAFMEAELGSMGPLG